MKATQQCPQCKSTSVIDSVQHVGQQECKICGYVWKPENVQEGETNAKGSTRRWRAAGISLLTLGGVIAVAGLLGAFKGHSQKPVEKLSRCTSVKLLSATQVEEGIAYCKSKDLVGELRYHSSGKVRSVVCNGAVEEHLFQGYALCTLSTAQESPIQKDIAK